MKVFISGGGGMVGRNLLSHPGSKTKEIYAPASGNVDLTDFASVSKAIGEFQPDCVIHCAGHVGGIQANIANPVDFLVKNMDMGRNVLLASAEHGVGRVINLGSSCMYPRAAPNPLTEDLVLTGELEPTNEGYALAKIVTARLADYLTRSREGLSYKTLIPSNLYGYFDKFDPAVSHLVPAIIRKVHEAKMANAPTVEIWGDGTTRREFLFALDLADAIWTGVDRFDELPAYMNVGLGRDYSINEYYSIAADIIGWKGEFTHDLSKPTGMKQKLVSTALQATFGWSPKTSLEEGISMSYDHFRDITGN